MLPSRALRVAGGFGGLLANEEDLEILGGDWDEVGQQQLVEITARPA